jgi:DNA-binding NarL/FixJ family response regulator
MPAAPMPSPSPDPAIQVVVCDDVSEMRKLLRFALETDPRMRVVGEADNGRDGARMIADLQPDVVLLDLSMPEMDGLEAIPEIVSSAPDTGIIVFSGFAAERMKQPALTSGADRYIEKGSPLDDIIAAVRDVADARRGDPGRGNGDSTTEGGFFAAWLARLGRGLARRRPGPARVGQARG